MRQLVFIAISLLFMVSCDSSNHSSDLKLNDGKKWEVNAEMKPHIEEGNDILNRFIAQNDTVYKALSEKLKDQNSNLIRSCTMKGESHDELHKWLHPHMGLIDNLSNATNADDAKAIVAELKESFKTYKTYFE